MKRLLTALALLVAATAQAQLVTEVRLNSELMLSPGTFLLRDTPVIAVYQGGPVSGESSAWNRQAYPSHDSILRAYRSYGYTPVRVNDLSTAPARALLRRLGHNGIEVPGTGYLMNVVDDEFALLRIMGTGYDGRREVYTAFLIPLEVLSVNGHKLLLAHGFGTFLPVGDGFRLFHNDRETKFERHRDAGDPALRRLVRQHYTGGMLFRAGGRQGLRTPGGRILIPARYDTITTTGPFLAAHTPRGVDLYFYNGDPLPHAGVRAVRFDTESGGVSIAQDDATHWLDADGNSTPTPPMRGYCGTGTHHRVTRIEPANDSFWLRTVTVQEEDSLPYGATLLTVNPSIESIRFLTGQPAYESRGVAAGFAWPDHPFLVRYRDGRTGIAEFEKGQPHFLLPPGPYTFRDLGARLRFEGGGIGLYPLHRTPRYAALTDFDKGFARYRLPDGVEGWVDFEGKEYPDR